MGLEELEKAIRQEACERERELLGKARLQAAEVVKQAELQGEAEAGRILAEAGALAGEEARKVSSARLRARKIVAAAREKCVQAAISGLMQSLLKDAAAKSGESRKRYEKLLAQLAKRAAAEIGGGAELHCRAQDVPIVGKFGRAVGGAKLPGVTAFSQGGLVKAEYTFAALIEQRQDVLKQKAFKMFFGGARAAAAAPCKAAPEGAKVKLVKVKVARVTAKPRCKGGKR